MKVPDPASGKRMRDRIQAVALRQRKSETKNRRGLDRGPLRLAANLRGINTLMLDFYDDPQFVNELLTFATELGIAFARAQHDAGAELIGVGDAAASLVGRPIFEKVIAPYHLKLVAALRAMGLKTRSHICGNTTTICAARAEHGYDIYDIDSPVNLDMPARRWGRRRSSLATSPPLR